MDVELDRIIRGADYSITVRIKDKAGTVQPTSGYTIAANVRDQSGTVTDMTVTASSVVFGSEAEASECYVASIAKTATPSLALGRAEIGLRKIVGAVNAPVDPNATFFAYVANDAESP